MEDLSFADYLIYEIKITTLEEWSSPSFQYWLFEGYYEGYKTFCKENGYYYENIPF